MPQSKILVDTNTYLRLAKTIRPLLFRAFGPENYCLYILPELNQELGGTKLKTKFEWVEDDEFSENRQHFPKVSRKQKTSIAQSFEYMWDFVQSDLPGPSKVDTLYIAYALTLDIPVVTDDQDMTQLAAEFEAQTMPTLQLLRLMVDCGHTDLATVNQLVGYWKYLSDLPANSKADFQRLFGGQIPP